MSTRHVILLHGLWMGPWSMGLLGRRLRQAGFETEFVGYASVRGGPEEAIVKLAGRAQRGPCHVVAHSLGGLIALAALERYPALPVERVVCLGSPLCGSATAVGFGRLPGLGEALGRSAGLLGRGCRPWCGRAEVGVIAGRQPYGLGRLISRFEGDSDGTVAVEETRLDGLADHVVVRTSHSGMLVTPEVARQTVAFLEDGCFGGGSGPIRMPVVGKDVPADGSTAAPTVERGEAAPVG